MTMIRFAIWAAVSTESQAAADKISLPDQVARCRKVAVDKNWVESIPPYIIPGESRTRHVNLRDAETAIPELHSMLDAAQAGKFDVLVMVDFNRLRDLLNPVAKTLAHYNVQIYSLAQPVEPILPESYSPYASDASAMMQSLSHLISVTQINDLRRKYKMAMPRRITDRGLPAHIPWGYTKPPGRETDRAAVPVQDSDKCAVLIQAKDALLSGQSLTQICEIFTNSNFSPPNNGRIWYPQTIRAILRNPFYAGVVRFGVSQAKLDPRTGARFRDRSHPQRAVTGPGKHIPIWDMQTYSEIISELSRRGKNYRGRKNNQLTGLVKCGKCEKSMWIFYDGHGQSESNPAWRVWRCSSRLPHRPIKHDDLVNQVGHELVTSIRSHLENKSAPDVRINLTTISDQRTRLEDAYQAGLMTIESFSDRVAELDKLEQAAADVTTQQREYQARQSLLQGLASKIEHIPDYLAGGDPQEINKLLHLLLSKIVVYDNKIELIYR